MNKLEFDNIKIKALPGSSFIKKDELESLKPVLHKNIQIKPFNYGDLLDSKIVISTFGVTTYELIYSGIPVISIAHADPNARGSQILSNKFPVIQNLGHVDNLTYDHFTSVILNSVENKDLFTSFRKICSNLIDGKGSIRIKNIILDQFYNNKGK